MTSFLSPRAAGDRPRLKIRGPADLILAVPYLLGFHPSESLVVVGLAGGLVVVTARVDLADVVAPQREGGDVLAGTLAAMANGGSEQFVGMVFDDRACPQGTTPAGPLPWHGLADAFEQEVHRLVAGLDDVLLISCGRWWSYHCDAPECCPRDGLPLSDAGSVVPATAAFAGMVALPDRATLAELLAPEPADVRRQLLEPLTAREAVLRLTALAGDGAPPRPGRTPSRAQRARQASTAARQSGTSEFGRDDLASIRRAMLAAARRASAIELSTEELVRFGAALRVVDVRDAVWLAVDSRRIDGRELWRHLGRRLPDPYAAAPLFLFGWASWRAGEGALANIAADGALTSDPSYTAADLLLAALSRGIDPRRMPPLRMDSA